MDTLVVALITSTNFVFFAAGWWLARKKYYSEGVSDAFGFSAEWNSRVVKYLHEHGHSEVIPVVRDALKATRVDWT